MDEPSGQPNISCWRNTPVDKRWTDVPHYNMEIDRLFSLWEAPSGMGEPWKLVRAPLHPALHRAAFFPASPRHPAVSRGAYRPEFVHAFYARCPALLTWLSFGNRPGPSTGRARTTRWWTPTSLTCMGL